MVHVSLPPGSSMHLGFQVFLCFGAWLVRRSNRGQSIRMGEVGDPFMTVMVTCQCQCVVAHMLSSACAPAVWLARCIRIPWLAVVVRMGPQLVGDKLGSGTQVAHKLHSGWVVAAECGVGWVFGYAGIQVCRWHESFTLIGGSWVWAALLACLLA